MYSINTSLIRCIHLVLYSSSISNINRKDDHSCFLKFYALCGTWFLFSFAASFGEIPKAVLELLSCSSRFLGQGRFLWLFTRRQQKPDEFSVPCTRNSFPTLQLCFPKFSILWQQHRSIQVYLPWRQANIKWYATSLAEKLGKTCLQGSTSPYFKKLQIAGRQVGVVLHSFFFFQL